MPIYSAASFSPFLFFLFRGISAWMSLMFFIFLPPSASSLAKKVHRYKKDGKEYKDPVLSYPFHLIMIASKDPRLFLQLSHIRYNHGNIFFFDPFDPWHISKSPV